MVDVGLYDSDTDESLRAEKTVDVTSFQDEAIDALLVFTRAKRGRIVQLQLGALHIHYFMDEPGGRRMMQEDSWRFGFGDQLLSLVDKNAPPIQCGA